MNHCGQSDCPECKGYIALESRLSQANAALAASNKALDVAVRALEFYKSQKYETSMNAGECPRLHTIDLEFGLKAAEALAEIGRITSLDKKQEGGE